jgi:xanthine dehydrogenase accessory factor
MRKILQLINRNLSNEISVVLCSIVKTTGSTARKAGAKMLVSEDGTFVGTIGGGMVEARALETAKEVFVTRRSQLRDFDLSGKVPEEMDMLCGGKQRILIEFLPAWDHDVRNLFQQALQNLESKTPALMITLMRKKSGRVSIRRGVTDHSGAPIVSTGDFREIFGQFEQRWDSGFLQPQYLESGDVQCFMERLLSRGELLLVGAGHISYYLSKLAVMVEFGSYVMDDRPALLNEERFPDVEGFKPVNESYDHLFQGFKVDRSTFIVICSRGHTSDRITLSQALRTDAAYIGMIGSKRKRDKIYKALMEEGVPESELSRVRCPVGIPIGDETPEEIAVGIVAELIKSRAEIGI